MVATIAVSIMGSGCGSLKTAVDFFESILRMLLACWLASTSIGLDAMGATDSLIVTRLVFDTAGASGRWAGRNNALGLANSFVEMMALSFNMLPSFLPRTWISSFADICRVVLLTSANAVRLAAVAFMLPTWSSVERAGVDLFRECKVFPAGSCGGAFSLFMRSARSGRWGYEKE